MSTARINSSLLFFILLISIKRIKNKNVLFLSLFLLLCACWSASKFSFILGYNSQYGVAPDTHRDQGYIYKLKELVFINPWQFLLPQRTISAMLCPMQCTNVRTVNRAHFTIKVSSLLWAHSIGESIITQTQVHKKSG